MEIDTKGLERYLEGFQLPAAVIVGLCPHGLAILRSLEKSGIRCICLESNFAQPSVRTRYGFKIRCSDIHGPDLIRDLQVLAGHFERKPVLFLTNDKMVRLVAGSEPVRQKYINTVPDPDTLYRFLDKEQLIELASSKGISLPRTVVIRNDEDVENAADIVGFPAIFKPTLPMSAFKVFKIADREELREKYRQYKDVIPVFMAQEWIPGNDSEIYYGAYCLGNDSKPIAMFSGRKIRQHPRSIGTASASEGFPNHAMMEEGARLFEGSGLRGCVSTEYKRDVRGNLRFIEVTTGRSDYNVETAIVNGVNFPLILYKYLTGGKIPATVQENRVVWVDLVRDVPVFLECLLDPNIPKKELARFLFGEKKFSLASRGDMKPLLFSLPVVFGNLCRAGWNRIIPGNR